MRSPVYTQRPILGQNVSARIAVLPKMRLAPSYICLNKHIWPRRGLHMKTKKAIYFAQRGLICAIWDGRQVGKLPIGKINFYEIGFNLQIFIDFTNYIMQLWKGNA